MHDKIFNFEIFRILWNLKKIKTFFQIFSEIDNSHKLQMNYNWLSDLCIYLTWNKL